MKNICALFLLVMTAGISSAILAAENSNPATLTMWEKLQKKVETFTPQKKISATNAVGGVRGALADANDIYWKGEATHEMIDAEEMAAFKKAMGLGAAGETSQAQEAFSTFIKNYPDSPLKNDANQALAGLTK